MSTFSEIINREQPVLVDFFAEWCGPCKTMVPVLKQIISQIGNSARILKIDIDKNPAVAAKYNVRSVPTFILFKKGEIKWQQSGAIPGHVLIEVIQKFK